MKIVINVDENQVDTEIAITCNRLTPEIEKIISLLGIYDMKLTGKKDNEIFVLNAADIIYIDTVEKRTFLYTKAEIYESNLKLYELEEQLTRADFIRVSKSSILNMRHIMSLKADLNRRIKVTMSNREQLYISRQYADLVKQRLGVH